jgi:SAM-dependent methyltransferase
VLYPVGSTSWHHRHLACFQRLNRLLVDGAVTHPAVLIVGPGAVTSLAAPLLNDAATPTGRWRRLIGDAARYGDQLLRRVPGLALRSLEPVEVEAALTIPHRLIVVDCSQRVLAAVSRQLPQAECHLVDIAAQPLSVQADVVIAFNVVCRLADPARGMAHVATAVRPGGWLLIDDRSARAHLSAHPEFTTVAPKTHRRVG